MGSVKAWAVVNSPEVRGGFAESYFVAICGHSDTTEYLPIFRTRAEARDHCRESKDQRVVRVIITGDGL